jgi:hypothetical protein
MNLLLAAAASLALALAGAGVLRLCWTPICGIPGTARLGLGFCMGCFLVSLLFFLSYFLGLKFSRLVLLTPVILLLPLGALTMVGSTWVRPRFSFPGFLALLLVLLSLALSWGRPVYGYDALAMWALKAKIAFFAKTWPRTLFDPHTTFHPDYPPLVPNAQAFVFFWLNQFDDVASRVVFAAFFASGAAILSWWLGALRVPQRSVWLLWWCAVPLMLDQVKTTYADLPLAVCLLVFFGAAVSWLRDPQRPDWLRLAGIFGGLAFWVKQDAAIGIGAGLAMLALVAAIRKLPLRPVREAVLLAAMLATPWRLMVWWKHLHGDFGGPVTPDFLPRCAAVAQAFVRYTVMDDNYAFFWPLLIVTLIFCAPRLRKAETLWLLLTLVAGAMIIAGVYLSSQLDLQAQLQTSMERVLLSLFVPALFLMALLWRGGFSLWRRGGWQGWAVLAMVPLVIARFWIGLHRKSDEELVGFTISPFALAMSWVWLAVGVVTVIKFLAGPKRARFRLVWRTAQFAVLAATAGLAVVAVAVYAREAGELRRRFGGKTLEQQHDQVLDPEVAGALAAAEKQFPPGAHVRAAPKRSHRYHQFYYESFPALVVDDSAPHAVDLGAPP